MSVQVSILPDSNLREEIIIISETEVQPGFCKNYFDFILFLQIRSEH